MASSDDGGRGPHCGRPAHRCGSGEDCAVESALRRRWALEVQDMLAGLDPLPRAAVELAYFQRLTHLQIAARLAAPLADVRRAVSTGMSVVGTALAGTSLPAAPPVHAPGAQPDTRAK